MCNSFCNAAALLHLQLRVLRVPSDLSITAENCRLVPLLLSADLPHFCALLFQRWQHSTHHSEGEPRVIHGARFLQPVHFLIRRALELSGSHHGTRCCRKDNCAIHAQTGRIGHNDTDNRLQRGVSRCGFYATALQLLMNWRCSVGCRVTTVAG